MGESADWSDLPKELWPMMGIETNIDLLRFRSIWKSCRSSLLPRITVSLRFPPRITITTSSGKHLLRSNIIYRLELSDLPETLSHSSFSKAWLIKVEESNYGRLYLLDHLQTGDSTHTRTPIRVFSSIVCGLDKKIKKYKKHLVGSCGSLYVVDMYYEGDPNQAKGACYDVVDLKVYKLDEEWGTRLDVKNLDEHAFVLAKDCNFSLPAREYHGCEENCIYFSNRGSASMFNLETSTFNSAKVFWPCPTLFDLCIEKKKEKPDDFE